MSLFSYPIGREAPIYKQLTTDTITVLYTAGQNGATIVALSVNEINGSTPTINLDVIDASETIVTRRANVRAMSARENWAAVKLNETPIVLLPNHALRAKASAANQIDIDGVVIEPPQR